MPKQSKDARLKLGEPLAGDLQDFCAAHYNCPAVEVVREAVRKFIDERLAAEPAVRERYEAARKRRMGAAGNVEILTPRGSR